MGNISDRVYNYINSIAPEISVGSAHELAVLLENDIESEITVRVATRTPSPITPYLAGQLAVWMIDDTEALRYFRDKNKIQLIKLVRSVSARHGETIGLKDAKDFVDGYFAGGLHSTPPF